MLLVGDRVVLRADAPPEAEYALFDVANIELRASEPGRVREHGYQTNVAEARARLEDLGLTAALAQECAALMQPVLSTAYARGPSVRIVSRYLSSLELFQSDIFSGTSQSYRGVFVDLEGLARDLEEPRVGAVMQALYLAALLETETDDTVVLLSTDAWTRPRKPGQRTFKRPQFVDVDRLRFALASLADRNPSPEVHEPLARADVIAFVRARADTAADQATRELYASLERAISARDMPDRGPLAEPNLWALEARMDAGTFDNILEQIEAVEHVTGRTPGSTYLRARASLALHLEPPKLIAERVSALALSMTSFQELTLLAAEAWLEAGELRRAIPYARDLVDTPTADEGLRVRANRILARAVGAAPNNHQTFVDAFSPAPLPPSQRPAPPLTAPPVHAAHSWAPAKSRVPTERGGSEPSPALDMHPSRSRVPTEREGSEPAAALDTRASKSRAPTERATGSEPSAAFDTRPSSPRARTASTRPSLSAPPPPPLPAIPPGRADHASTPPFSSLYKSTPAPHIPSTIPPPPGERASFTLELPRPSHPPVAKSGPPPPARSGTHPPLASRPGTLQPRRGAGIVAVETRAPPSHDPRAEPDSSSLMRAAHKSRAPEVGLHSRPTPMRPTKMPLDAELPTGTQASDTLGETPPVVVMAGASSPPFRLEDPAPVLPGVPLIPRLSGHADALAENLVLPPGLETTTHSLDALPTSIIDARITFTLLARELGVDYRLRRGIELRADVTGIEAMQSVLLGSFPDHTVRTTDDVREVRRHGALLSEILARRLDAEWIDISPSELGYWAMIVPPDTRVWPFGRVARLIKMGHKERDLVSFFFEIQGRSRRR